MLEDSITNNENLRKNLEKFTKPGNDEMIISPVHIHTKEEIKEIRKKQNMTQKQFALALGVALRTVETWERGLGSPLGPVNRLLEMMSLDNNLFEKYSIATKPPKKLNNRIR